MEISEGAPAKDLPLKASIKQIKALLVSEVGAGAFAGFAQSLMATANKTGEDSPLELEFNQPVGLKVFSATLKDDPEKSIRLARESRIAVQVAITTQSIRQVGAPDKGAFVAAGVVDTHLVSKAARSHRQRATLLIYEQTEKRART